MSYQEEQKTKKGGNDARTRVGGYDIAPLSGGLRNSNSHFVPQQQHQHQNQQPGPPQMIQSLARSTNGSVGVPGLTSSLAGERQRRQHHQQQNVELQNLLGNTSVNTNQSAQTLLTQLQSVLSRTQQPNQVLLRTLQQMIQPNLLGSATAPGTHTGTISQSQQVQIAQQQTTVQSQPFQSGDRKDGMKLASNSGGASDGKKPDTTHQHIIVPCRARGVPPDHTAATAYFSIPHNVKHGTNLFCSHQGCRDNGIKFCYCSHCGIPVAKRNFRQRHHHKGDKKEKEECSRGRLHTSGPAVQPAIKAAAQSARQPARFKQQIESSSRKKRRGSKEKKNLSSRKPDGSGGKKHQRSSIREPPLFREDRRNISNSSECEDVDRFQPYHDVERRWNSLLRERPREDPTGDATSQWLLSVLNVSDSRPKDLPHEETPSFSASSSISSSGNAFRKQSSEPSEETSSPESSENPSSESTDSQEAGSSRDTNAHEKFVHQSQPVSGCAVRTYGISTESSGPTDQSGGVSTGACNPTTSTDSNGAGTNSTGGSSSDSEYCSKTDSDLQNPIHHDLKRPSTDGELTEPHRPPVKKRKKNSAD